MTFSFMDYQIDLRVERSAARKASVRGSALGLSAVNREHRTMSVELSIHGGDKMLTLT